MTGEGCQRQREVYASIIMPSKCIFRALECVLVHRQEEPAKQAKKPTQETTRKGRKEKGFFFFFRWGMGWVAGLSGGISQGGCLPVSELV